MGNCFWCYFREIFISLAFRKCKKEYYILEIILVQCFCPLKTAIGFRLPHTDVFPEVISVKLLGSFRFDYEYEVEYEYDFRISNQ